MQILVTGATGFVGRRLLQRLVGRADTNLRAAVRRPDAGLDERVSLVQVGDLGPDTDWAVALQAVDVVVHSAARVHVMSDTSADPLSEFRLVNVQGTLRLARQAVAAGVKRFIFVSSIKVNGEETSSGRPYTADDRPAPVDAYGQSKLEAEQALLALALESGMEVVIVRPVLIYGPGVKANFRSMMSWLYKGVPLPLGAIDNRRSLVGIDNLIDLLSCCMSHPAAANQIFLVSDGHDLSTSAMLRDMARALGRPARLLPLPASWLRAIAGLLGKQQISQRLCGSLQVDLDKNKRLLGWTPPHSTQECFRTAAMDFLENQQR